MRPFELRPFELYYIYNDRVTMTPTQNAVENLKTRCLQAQMPWNDRASDRFAQYIDLILHYQKQTNLTGFSTPQALVDNMILDSLQILRVLTPTGPLVDVGSGAGFPAVPLKILFPDVEMHLVEPRTKRYAFLGLVQRQLGLSGLIIHGTRIENAGLTNIKTAISKAFAPPAEWLEICRPWADSGARVAGFFSRDDYENIRHNLPALGWNTDAVYECDHRVYIVFLRLT